MTYVDDDVTYVYDDDGLPPAGLMHVLYKYTHMTHILYMYYSVLV